MLFFDEADVDFGKRSTVEDVRDRYGNRHQPPEKVILLAANFFAKEVKKLTKRFDQIYKACFVWNLNTKYSVLLLPSLLRVRSTDITKATDKKTAKESMLEFYRSRDMLNNLFSLMEREHEGRGWKDEIV